MCTEALCNSTNAVLSSTTTPASTHQHTCARLFHGQQFISNTDGVSQHGRPRALSTSHTLVLWAVLVGCRPRTGLTLELLHHSPPARNSSREMCKESSVPMRAVAAWKRAVARQKGSPQPKVGLPPNSAGARTGHCTALPASAPEPNKPPQVTLLEHPDFQGASHSPSSAGRPHESEPKSHWWLCTPPGRGRSSRCGSDQSASLPDPPPLIKLKSGWRAQVVVRWRGRLRSASGRATRR